jgi:large subunit ribosomal protein L22
MATQARTTKKPAAKKSAAPTKAVTSARAATKKSPAKKVSATIRYIHMAPQKVQRIANLVRGLDVTSAEHLLASVPKRASIPVMKAIHSAAASAVHNNSLDRKSLFVESISVGQSLVLPRFMPRAQGRAFKIRKRFSHINIVVAERAESKKAKPSANKKAAVAATPARTASVISSTKIK